MITRHIRFVFRIEETPGYLFLVFWEASAHFYVNSWSPLYVHHSGARKKLLRKALLMNKVKVLSTTVFVGQGV